jgi:hypothetical protein
LRGFGSLRGSGDGPSGCVDYAVIFDCSLIVSSAKLVVEHLKLGVGLGKLAVILLSLCLAESRICKEVSEVYTFGFEVGDVAAIV